MFFVILCEVNATVHVESGFGISEDLHIQAMEEYKYKVNESFYYQANLEVTDMSFYFSSTEDITLFCYHVLVNRGDGYLALPTETLSTEYIVVTHIDNHTGDQILLPYTKTTQTAFLVVATEDNTQVNISLKIQGPLMAGGCGNGTFFNGESRTFTLNRYQTVGAYCAEDITGTLITSDKPVAVISGHNMKYTTFIKDGMQEMLLPVKSFGRSYYLPVPPSITGGAIYRVVGSVASTSVRSPYVSNISNISFSVGERESHDITVDSTTGPVYIEADKPVMVVQIAIKTPSLALVPPTSLYSSSYDIGKPVLHATYDLKKVYITVIVPTDKVLGIRPQIFPQFKVIKGSCFSEASVELTTPGFYRLTHVDDVPFGAMMYVFPFSDTQCVFTHPAGLNLTNDVASGGCTVDRCQYSSSCTDLTTLYQCDCVNGSGGAHCETDGSCEDQVGNYTCNCTAGYTGSFCETDIDDCATNPCVNGTCVDHVNNYTCTCEPGYTDWNCSTDIDECVTKPCVNGTCVDHVNNYTCDCDPGYTDWNCSTDIDDCATNPCVNGTCVDHVNNYTCTCDPGYTDWNCSTEIDECSTNPCVHGTCDSGVNNYTCDCEPGYTDMNCSTDIDDCATNPCVNGTCVDHVNNFTCTCEPGYTDQNCSTDIDDCATKPCVNGACSDHVNNYTCDCEPGYTDWNCSTDIDECATNPCVNGTCVDHVNNYTCDCEPGYTDWNCSTDIDDCAQNPCVNGTCVDHVNNYTCDCKPGYTDRNCSTDIDDCATSPCVNGSCVDQVNNYTCVCDPGYTDRNCSTDIDECASTPCLHGGNCTDMVDGYICTCRQGTNGTRCQTVLDPCVANPCKNNGSCTQTSGGFNCSCPPGIVGDSCQTDIDDCASSPCRNNGTCSDRVNAFKCQCPANYSGFLCQFVLACGCPCLTGGNITVEQLAAKVALLRSILLVNKAILSKTIRKKTSAPDERRSSAGIGLGGIVCLVGTFAFFLFVDCLNFIKLMPTKKVQQSKIIDMTRRLQHVKHPPN
ncbi:fibropellin-1-like [Haliotis rubra]|uniref:fibropellin-1-like n=1 Tax=Haliotis rubra TaxID=36100 RepID=UPI001EE569D8|nr:fibropellin-1-like [Haliotis rubra]